MKNKYLLFKRFIKLEDCNSAPGTPQGSCVYSRQLNGNWLSVSSEAGQKPHATGKTEQSIISASATN